MNSVHDFLNHRTSEQRGSFLGADWKKLGKLEHFLHGAHIPVCVWQHSILSVVPKENQQSGEIQNHVWQRKYNCPEAEVVLKQQYFRNRDGTRQKAPMVCGVCKLVDWCMVQLDAGVLSLETPMFRFKGDIPAEEKVVYVGGFCGLLTDKKLKPESKKRVLAAGISLNWEDVAEQNGYAKAAYLAVVIPVAPAGKVPEGPRIATISGGLGDKLKEAITQEMKKATKPAQMRGASQAEIAAAAAAADPFTHPYMFEWTYDAQETNPQKMYGVVAHVQVPPGEEYLQHIRGDALDLSNLLAPMSQKATRLRLEKACLLLGKNAPPWDKLFVDDGKADEAAEAAEATEASDDPDMEFPLPAARASAQVPAGVEAPTPVQAKKTPEEICAGISPDDLFGCEVCGKGSPTASECVWCGAKYDDQGVLIKEAAPPPPPKQMRTRKPTPFKAGF
jgi:hypothetical protein